MRTIAVTGAASGIGAATAARLEAEGCRVIRVDWKGGDVVADLGTPAGREAAIAGVRRLAGDTLDGLVSGAGLGPYDDPTAVVRVNYFGAVAVLDGLLDLLARGHAPSAVAKQALAPAVRQRARAWGAAGVRLNAVLPGKVATPMLATIHRHEALGPLVGALPVPLGREAAPEELAAAIVFLLGPDARYVHGALLHVDGGVDAQVRPTAL